MKIETVVSFIVIIYPYQCRIYRKDSVWNLVRDRIL